MKIFNRLIKWFNKRTTSMGPGHISKLADPNVLEAILRVTKENCQLEKEVEELQKEIAGGANKYARNYCEEFNGLLETKDTEIEDLTVENKGLWIRIEKLVEENKQLKKKENKK